MNKSLTITWLLLLVLTIASAIFSNIESKYVVSIMILAALKFLGVAFQFMELKKAHSFWKGLTFVYLTGVTILILVMK